MHFIACCSFVSLWYVSDDLEENRGPLILGAREILQSMRGAQDARGSSSTDALVRGLPKLQQVLLFAVWQQTVEVNRLQEIEGNKQSGDLMRPKVGPHKRFKSASCRDNKARAIFHPMKLCNIYNRYVPLHTACVLRSCLIVLLYFDKRASCK